MKVKKMIRDKEESQKISENFMKSKYYQCLNTSLKMNVLIATQNVWPLTHTSIPVLECLKEYEEIFKKSHIYKNIFFHIFAMFTKIVTNLVIQILPT